MKTERRHELQTNRLADWTGNQLQQVRPHAKKVLGAAILGAAVIIAALVIMKDRQAALSLAWNDFYLALSARDRDALASVAKTHAGTVVALWAKQGQADLDLSNGIGALYTNRDEAFKSLDDAKKAYSEVVNEGISHPELQQHSLFGLAQANEATSNLEKAREYYQKVVQQFPDTPMGKEARARLDALKDPQVEKWYNWFARQKPKPGGLPQLPNLPGMPEDFGKLSDKPDLPVVPLTPEAPAAAPASKTEGSPPTATSDSTREETPKPDAPKPDAPKPDAPKPDAPKPDAPKPDAPKPDAPKPDAPKPDAPKPSSGAEGSPGDSSPP